MTLNSSSIGLLGKLPQEVEFVRLGSRAQPFDSFDDWLAKNMEWAERRGAAAWKDAFSGGAAYAFVFSQQPPALPALAGALVPSADRAGRQYPFVAAAPLVLDAALCSQPQSLPLLLESCWELTSELALGGELPPEGRQTQLPTSTAAAREEALTQYREWARALTLGQLWAMIFGASAAEAAARVGLVARVVLAFRGVERPRTPLSLRLPLGVAGGAAVCFWIDLVRRLARWNATVPSFFWSHDGETGNLILHLGDPPAGTLLALWMPAHPQHDFCDLTEAEDTRAAGGAANASGLFAKALAATDDTVEHFLASASAAE